ncbi:hypothetical protein BGZ89_001009 [Linnemannia elongata]|nr:hypothetical protein BGZ89_001009 [Linnemannia elongata]
MLLADETVDGDDSDAEVDCDLEITEDGNHRFKSRSKQTVLPFSQLAKKGAYSEKMIYTKEDIFKFINYAMSRGVHIMTCIGWLPYGAAFSADLLSGRLNPIRPKTYKVIQGIYNQVLPLFKDKANSIILWMFSRTINIPASVSQHEDTIIRLRTLATNIKAATS